MKYYKKDALASAQVRPFSFTFQLGFCFFRVIYTFCLNRVFSCMSLLVGNSPGAVAV